MKSHTDILVKILAHQNLMAGEDYLIAGSNKLKLVVPPELRSQVKKDRVIVETHHRPLLFLKTTSLNYCLNATKKEVIHAIKTLMDHLPSSSKEWGIYSSMLLSLQSTSTTTPPLIALLSLFDGYIGMSEASRFGTKISSAYVFDYGKLPDILIDTLSPQGQTPVEEPLSEMTLEEWKALQEQVEDVSTNF